MLNRMMNLVVFFWLNVKMALMAPVRLLGRIMVRTVPGMQISDADAIDATLVWQLCLDKVAEQAHREGAVEIRDDGLVHVNNLAVIAKLSTQRFEGLERHDKVVIGVLQSMDMDMWTQACEVMWNTACLRLLKTLGHELPEG